MDSQNNICKQHTGFLARIMNIEKENVDQWNKISIIEGKMDAIFTRLNIILGGVVVACVMLAINILVNPV